MYLTEVRINTQKRKLAFEHIYGVSTFISKRRLPKKRKKFQILFAVKSDDNNNVDFDSFFIALLNRVLWMPADYRYC